MALRLRFLDGPRAGHVLEYGDEIERVVLGRDPQRCRVVFPADQVVVGREHVALRRELGRYRLVLNAKDPVFVGRSPAKDDQELESPAEIQLGVNGPRLIIETLGNSELPETMRRTDRIPGPAPGRDTMVRGLDRGLRRTRAITIAAIAVLTLGLLAVAGVAGAGWWSSHQRLKELDRAQSATIRELKDRMQALREKIQPRISEALAKASPSVYLVVIRDAKGHEVGAATAWVVGEGVLATNAHVADLYAKAVPEGGRLLVRSNAAAPVDFTVTKAELHPGYSEFQQIWTDYKPGKDSLGPTLEQLQQVSACDIGLLHVEAAAGLAPPLPLADPQTIEALAAGDVVGYVGYPMESMALGGVNVKQPTPQMQVGNVTAVTDFFLMKSTGDGQLVQNSLPILGGASGSPILDAAGRVVALVSAANLTLDASGTKRISTGSGVNFGQRADLLRELLDGKAAQAQEARSARWRRDITRFVSLRNKLVEVQVGAWMEGFPGRTPTRVAKESGPTASEHRPGTWTWSKVLELKGDCLVVAVSGADSPVSLYAFDAAGGSWSDEHLLASDVATAWYSVISFPAGGKVDLVVASAVKDVPVTIHVYRAGH